MLSSCGLCWRYPCAHIVVDRCVAESIVTGQDSDTFASYAARPQFVSLDSGELGLATLILALQS